MNVLTQANDIVRRKWNSVGAGWKVAMTFGFVLLAALGVLGLCIWFLGHLLKSLNSPRNASLYFPARRRA